MTEYLNKVYNNIAIKNAHELEYLSSVKEFLNSIQELNIADLEQLAIMERLIEPERIITFQVPWTSDLGKVHVNTGYRVQSNSLLGPYKGGIRYSKDVNLSVLKFLGFEQTLKNSLTTLNLGGAKGGSDFDPTNKSDLEIMRFSKNYMRELYRHIGANTDVPAGDIGVSRKEIGYLYGEYKKITNLHDGTFTGKNPVYGGSLLRPEATGYGIIYILKRALLTYLNKDLKGLTTLVSGSGQVGLNAAIKARDEGMIVVGVNNITGSLYDKDGLDLDLVKSLQDNKESFTNYLNRYPKATFNHNPKTLWTYPAKIAIPCAKENELNLDDAKQLINNGLEVLVEGANKPSTNDAINYFLNEKIIFIPSKAANAGGVSVSSLEMSQNASFSNWSSDKVDSELMKIMNNIFDNIYNTAITYGNKYDLVKGANIAAFIRLYEAMREQGI